MHKDTNANRKKAGSGAPMVKERGGGRVLGGWAKGGRKQRNGGGKREGGGTKGIRGADDRSVCNQETTGVPRGFDSSFIQPVDGWGWVEAAKKTQQVRTMEGTGVPRCTQIQPRRRPKKRFVSETSIKKKEEREMDGKRRG